MIMYASCPNKTFMDLPKVARVSLHGLDSPESTNIILLLYSHSLIFSIIILTFLFFKRTIFLSTTGPLHMLECSAPLPLSPPAHVCS